MTGTDFPRPLTGLKVIDLTQGLAGPYCAMMLAHHGADVIKVEPPSGDWSRTLGVPRAGMTAAFLACNRGKRSIVLDLKNPAHLAAVRTLAKDADVFMESNRAGVADRLGIGYEAIRGENDQIIYVSVTGYGQTGPYRDRPVTDAIMQAFSGFMTRNLDADGLPKRIEFAVPDYTTGLMAYQAVSTALLGRAMGQHGGRHVDVSLMGAMLGYQQANIIDWELGNHSVGTPLPPTGTYKTADGLMNVSIVRDKYFDNLCTALGCPELASDPRFSDLDARRNNATAIIDAITPAMAALTSEELERRFQADEVPHCRVNRYDEVVTDPHVLQTGTVASAEQPGIGPHPVFSPTGSPRPSADWASELAPTLGEHTAEVMASVGITLDG